MRIMADTKTDPTAHSTADAKRKLHIHVTCIIIAGVISTIIFQLHISNASVLGFGPIAPSIVQEVFDRIFRI